MRYPDPRALQSGSLPFMLKVEKIADGEADNLDNTRTGDLRFTVIGRASNNDFAVEKSVLYGRLDESAATVAMVAKRSNLHWISALRTSKVYAAACASTATFNFAAAAR